MDGPTIRALHPLVRLALEVGPLAVFFLANQRADIFAATGLFMAAVAAAVATSYALTRHWPTMPLVTGVVVLIFGGLTLWLHDDLFIKLKPTIVNVLFGATLLIGLAFKRPLLPYVLDTVFRLTDQGWRALTLRWGLFFFVLAGLNELVWRTQTTDFWVNFKVFGIMPLTLAFALAQTPLVIRTELKKADAA